MLNFAFLPKNIILTIGRFWMSSVHLLSVFLPSSIMNLLCSKKGEIWFNSCIYEGVSEKHLFKIIKSTTHQALAWGLVWKDPKGFLISTKFRGASSHFRFDHFYIADFHSALSARPREKAEWIYNVKVVKTEVARGTPKLCRNQKSFWILSN